MYANRTDTLNSTSSTNWPTFSIVEWNMCPPTATPTPSLSHYRPPLSNHQTYGKQQTNCRHWLVIISLAWSVWWRHKHSIGANTFLDWGRGEGDRVLTEGGLTLHPSHVIAPKWNPDEGAPHTEHGICAICDDTFVPPEKYKNTRSVTFQDISRETNVVLWLVRVRWHDRGRKWRSLQGSNSEVEKSLNVERVHSDMVACSLYSPPWLIDVRYPSLQSERN